MIRSLNASKCWILELQAEDLEDYSVSSTDKVEPQVSSLGEIHNAPQEEARNRMVLEWIEGQVEYPIVTEKLEALAVRVQRPLD